MIERPISAMPRVRAGSQPQRALESPHHWMKDRAPSLRTLARKRRRRERTWAWLSLLVLVVCWDVSSRLGEGTLPPRAEVAHVLEAEELFRMESAFSVDL